MADANLWYGNGTGRQYVFALKNLLFYHAASSGHSRNAIVQASNLNISEMMTADKERKVVQSFNFANVDAALHMVGKRTFIDRMVMSGYAGSVSLKGNVYFNRDMRELALSLNIEKL